MTKAISSIELTNAVRGQAAPDDHVDVIAEEDLLRAKFYGLLASLLQAPPRRELLETLKNLSGDETLFGQALTNLGEQAQSINHDDIEDEFTRLFYGHGAGGELHPYASFYLTGFIYDKPLLSLRKDLANLGLTRSPDTTEPEDHIAFLMNVMHDLIVGAHGDAVDLDVQKAFFDKHIAPWASRFFEDLVAAQNAAFFRPVGTVGKVLMEIETQAFSIAA